jgi:hypothetical protein
MKRTSSVLALAMLLASSARAQTQRFPTIAVGLPGYVGAIRLDTGGVRRDMPGNAADVFRATRAAFDALRIPVQEFDSTRFFLYNAELIRMRTMVGNRMSELLNCGQGFTSANADVYRITMAIAAFVEPVDADRSRLRVAFAAGGRSVEGASKDPVPCATTGLLESRIEEFVRNRVRTG